MNRLHNQQADYRPKKEKEGRTAMDMKTTPYYAIYADVYGLLSRFLPVRTDEEYWEAVMKETDILYRKYNHGDEPGHEYARKMILETVNELGRISNEMEAAQRAAAGTECPA